MRVAFRFRGGGALKGEFAPEVREEREGRWKVRRGVELLLRRVCGCDGDVVVGFVRVWRVRRRLRAERRLGVGRIVGLYYQSAYG